MLSAEDQHSLKHSFKSRRDDANFLLLVPLFSEFFFWSPVSFQPMSSDNVWRPSILCSEQWKVNLAETAPHLLLLESVPVLQCRISCVCLLFLQESWGRILCERQSARTLSVRSPLKRTSGPTLKTWLWKKQDWLIQCLIASTQEGTASVLSEAGIPNSIQTKPKRTSNFIELQYFKYSFFLSMHNLIVHPLSCTLVIKASEFCGKGEPSFHSRPFLYCPPIKKIPHWGKPLKKKQHFLVSVFLCGLLLCCSANVDFHYYNCMHPHA